jgi:hypothetical protein
MERGFHKSRDSQKFCQLLRWPAAGMAHRQFDSQGIRTSFDEQRTRGFLGIGERCWQGSIKVLKQRGKLVI